MNMSQDKKDEFFMSEALKEARKAFEKDEVPIGAVIVINDKIIARAHNSVQELNDATAHAEMIAITSAMNKLGSKFLPKATIYVTVEPCLMCIGAILHAKIKRLVYGCSEPKYGFYKFEKILNKNNTSLTGKLEIKNGVLEKTAADLMVSFFKEKRIF